MFALGRFGIKLGLDTIQGILEELDNPQDRFRCIHIAGTNGKGSIASALSTILVASGFRVGLYTSPHLVKFNERIAIDGVPITDEAVVEGYRTVTAASRNTRQPTFFEITTAMALDAFAKSEVDWAIIETGMGGRLDATNVVHPELSIITNISLEHQEYLGDNIGTIAREKGGIIKAGKPVVAGAEQEEARQVIGQIARDAGAPLYCLGREFSVTPRKDGSFDYAGMDKTWDGMRTSLLGEHQIDNAALTLAACEALTPALRTMGGQALSETVIREGLASTRWPGRLECVCEDPYILIDGAHNLAAARKLAAFLSGLAKTRKLTLIIGILDDKPYSEILETLLPVCDRAVLTSPKIKRSLQPEALLSAACGLLDDIRVIPSVKDAIGHAIDTASPGEAICIAGSLYVVGEAKEALADLL